jgi:hypothetical protein
MAVAREIVSEVDLPQAGRWLLRLRAANRQNPRYGRSAFEDELRERWYRIHEHIFPGSPALLLSYWTSPLACIHGIGWRRHKTFFDECLNPPRS